jgi:kinetochore protein Nuf2
MAALEAKAAERLTVRNDINKLRPYTLQSPQALQQQLADLTSTLAADKAHTDALDRRARALQTSADSFSVAAADVAGCIRLLEEMASELAKEEEESARNARQREALSERGNNVREVERAESMLQRQLQKWNSRTQKLRETSAAKAAEAKDKMAELRRLHKQLTDEWTETNREIERRRVRIEQTEKKVRAFFFCVDEMI